MMLAKRRPIAGPIPPRKKRKNAHTIEEINFDTASREDYLTGFHKRKLQRIKHAKEENAKKEREEKLAARKILREGRKADLEKHVEEVNAMLREARDGTSEPSEPEHALDQETAEEVQEKTNIDHKEEYMDDERFTTVTVEAVDVSRDGLLKAHDDAVDDEPIDKSKEADQKGRQKQGGGAKRTWTKERPNGSKKKKKFKYESKAERKATRFKERSGSKAKAKARRD